jgi:hypothetical protein
VATLGVKKDSTDWFGGVSYSLEGIDHRLRIARFALYLQNFIGMGEVDFPMLHPWEVVEFGLHGADAASAFDVGFEL